MTDLFSSLAVAMRVIGWLRKGAGYCAIFDGADLPIQSDVSGPSLQYRSSLAASSKRTFFRLNEFAQSQRDVFLSRWQQE